MFEDRIQRTDIAADDWSLGSPSAAVTLLEYGDFECPHCAAARPVLETLVAKQPGALRLVYRHFPITTIHPHAQIAAEAAEAAGAQGRFWEMHDTIFMNQQNLSYEMLRAAAATLGLDVLRFDREMGARVHLQEVKRDFRRGVQDGVNGTPTIFINRLRYDGPRDVAAMLSAIALTRRVTRGTEIGAA